MTEWLAVLIVVPLLVAPLILAFGFSGCHYIFKLESPPARPTIVSAVGMGLDAIRVEWVHPNAQSVTFEVVRTPDGGAAAPPIVTGDLFVIDTGLEEATTYFYQVRAVAGALKSVLSNEVSATTLAFEPAFVSTLTNNQTQQGGKCIVQRIEPARLLRSGGVVRITLQASTQGDVILEQVSISHAAVAGDPYDSDGAPTPVASALVLSAGTSLALPAVNFALDQTRPLLVAFDLGAPGHVRHLPGVPPVDAAAFVQDGDEALVQDRQPGYAVLDRIYLIERIDVV